MSSWNFLPFVNITSHGNVGGTFNLQIFFPRFMYVMLQKSCPNVFLLAAIREILLIVKRLKMVAFRNGLLKSSFDATSNIFKPVYKSLSMFEMMV